MRTKRSKKGVNKLRLAGLLLGFIGFLLPFFIQFEGLSFAGHMALGIFLMAACFWMLEPIPIYSTSLLVIMMQVILLSAQGPVYKSASLPQTMPVEISNDLWQVPKSAIEADGALYIRIDDKKTRRIEVTVTETRDDAVTISTSELNEGDLIVTNAGHWLVKYRAAHYSEYFRTLADPIIILFLGGFMLAGAAVKYNLDKNLTSVLLRPFGKRPMYIALGLMLVTAILSAFMSNTATTAMMMTVVIPITAQLPPEDRFKTALALSIPIAANVGGIATPIGTPPNAIVIAALNQQGILVPFGEWMLLVMPIVVVLLFVSWITLGYLFPPTLTEFRLKLEGKFNTSTNAIILYVIFGLTVVLWITEAQHGIPSSMVAFLPITALTVTSVMSKEDIRNLPWDVLWLVAGGIALGVAMDNTGLATWIVSSISWETLPKLLLLLVFGLVAYMMSNFLSNTVTATLIIPLAISIGTSGIAGEGFSLIITCIFVGIACNIAMMLPISTPPNAIAMSTGFLKTSDMVKVGIIVGLAGLITGLIIATFVWPFMI
jgi:solute carrier family 13 (sodium-dependent dicarboxylate transporter), member 2/3/5